jgi:hypothetical protein
LGKELNHKALKITSIVVSITIIVLLLGYFALSELNQKSDALPSKTPVPLVSGKIIADQDIVIPQYPSWINVSQGTSFKVNLTITSMAGQLEVRMQNLTVTYYYSQVKLGNPIDLSDNNFSSIPKSAFNYSFSINPITLQPIMSNSTIITVNLAEDAPIGQYFIAVRQGVEVLQSDGTFEQEDSHSNVIQLIVY